MLKAWKQSGKRQLKYKIRNLRKNKIKKKGIWDIKLYGDVILHKLSKIFKLFLCSILDPYFRGPSMQFIRVNELIGQSAVSDLWSLWN